LNKAQKEVLKASLADEKRTIREPKQVYGQAKKDVEERIRQLSARTDMENIQSIIYQKKYQEALKKQLDDVLDKLNTGQFNTVSDYLKVCYENGYIGNMYDLQHQGIPMTIPINQKKVVTALQTDTKLSSKKYKGNPLKGRLEEDIDRLKLSIRAELSRSVANGSSWNEVAVKIAMGMNNPFDRAYRNTLLIARTEGHRVQQTAKLDACQVAKDKGAEIVKQWDSTMDGLTRPWHREADGQIRELDEYFDVGGEKMKAPSIGGSAKNVCNCRCQLLQRARWVMDEDELEALKKRAEYFGLDKSESFDDFKKKYLKLPEKADTIKVEEQANGWNGLNYSQNYSTKKDAVKALKDKYEIDFSDSRKYPIDETMICDFVSWMDSFEKQYPDFVKNNPVKVPKICVKAPSSMKNAVGYFQYYVTGRPIELALNGYYHSSKDVFEAYEEKCIKLKWTVANATFHKTFVHEYGHYVSNTITQMKSKKTWESDFIKECIEDFKKQVPEYDKNTYIGLGDYVSRYGSTSASECFAEAFAEYFGNENPRTFAKIFGEKLEKVLKGVV
jgi:hypothetical protein